MEKKNKSFESFFKENRNNLPYYFKDLKATKLTLSDNNVKIDKVFNSKIFNSNYCKVERFYKEMIKI